MTDALVTHAPTNEVAPPYEKFVDTPLLAAKRRAFDYPSQANLDALIEAAKAEQIEQQQKTEQELPKSAQPIDQRAVDSEWARSET